MQIVHKIASWYLSKRIQRIRAFMDDPHGAQAQVLETLLSRGYDTVYGRNLHFDQVRNPEQFRTQIPIMSYEDMFPWIERAIAGESDILWPGRTEWFAKSSGTTNDRSKYIPVSPESFDETHFKSGRDMVALYLEQKTDSNLFDGKSLSITGSHELVERSDSRAGDLSAVLLENLPFFFEMVRTPSKQVALMDNWEEKIAAMLAEVPKADVRSISGVPTWTLVLIHRMFAQLGKPDANLLDIWPNIEIFFHGGVNFAPYRSQFETLIPGDQMSYMNIYNASEGFFACQDDLTRDDMLLMLDNGIYYEFVPLDEMEDENPRALTLPEVELDTIYALIISTNGGLWRYLIGDTISFTSLSPYRIRIAGRTKHFINAFGEELMMDNAEQAITFACEQTGASIENYTAAPIYFEGKNNGGHEWLIEFETEPNDQAHFNRLLDQRLAEVNSDYAAKRQGDIALAFPLIKVMPSGTFYTWMKKRGKLGGQHKVPRLSNDRRYVEQILEL
ncbi:MAG: GH3 auxin-responsive promoter family protein [Bacteroidia bacterium]